MKFLMSTALAVVAMMLIALPAQAADELVWNQGFETNTNGWLDEFSGWHGNIERVETGENDINSSVGEYHAIMEGDESGAPFSSFDDYRDTWTGEWTAEVDVYLDPNWEAGEGFDYSVAATRTDGTHLRDYIFHVGTVEDYGGLTGKHLLVNGSNNTDFYVNPYKLVNENEGNYYEVSSPGWYTLQHKFYDAGGYLAVDLNLIDDSGDIVWTATRSSATDTIPGEVGGNRYAWFTHIDVPGGIAVDEHQLFVDVPDTTAPVVEITSPEDGAVRGEVEVLGSVMDENPDHYYVVLKDSSGAVVAGSGTVDRADSFENELLFSFDSTLLDEDETYTIWLAARDEAGNRDDTAGSLDTVEVTVDNIPDDKNACKKGGWENYVDLTFKNQGQCISYIQSNEHAGKRD